MDIIRWPIPKSDWLQFLQLKMEKLYTVSRNKTGSWRGSDHELLVAKFRFKLKKAGKTTRPFRYDLNQVPWSNCQHPLDHGKRKRVPEKHLFLLYDYAKTFDCVDHNKLWKILKEMRLPDHLTCLLRNLYAGQEATVRTTRNNRLVPNRKRSASRLYIVTLLI